MLAAVMSPKLGQLVLKNYQAFPGRGAWIETEYAAPRVKLRGSSVTIIPGTVFALGPPRCASHTPLENKNKGHDSIPILRFSEKDVSHHNRYHRDRITR